MVKVRVLPITSELIWWVYLNHAPFLPQYSPMILHTLGLWYEGDPLPPLLDWGAWRWFDADQEDQARLFLRRMQSQPWRIHSRCRYCFWDLIPEAGKLPI